MKLRYTLPALADLEAILDYIDRQSRGKPMKVGIRGFAVVETENNPPIRSPDDQFGWARILLPPAGEGVARMRDG